MQNDSVNTFLFYCSRDSGCLCYGHEIGNEVFQFVYWMGKDSSILFDWIFYFDSMSFNHIYHSYFVHHHHAWIHLLVSFLIQTLWSSLLRPNYFHRLYVRSHFSILDVTIYVQRLHESSSFRIQPMVVLEFQMFEYDR